MKKVTKRILSAMLSAVMLIAMVGSGAVFANETEAEKIADWVIADFSEEGLRENITEWNGDDGYYYNTGLRTHKMSEITDEVSLDGGTSFKLDHRYGKLKADGTMGIYNTRLQTKDISGEKGNIGKLLNYDYLYAWIYSDKANGQKLNVMIFDMDTDKYYYKQPVMDYTGWKLFKFDISGYTLESFNNGNYKNTGEAAYAKETDRLVIQIQSSGWSATSLEDTILYFDSIWLSNDDLTETETVVVENEWTEEDYLIADFSVNSTLAVGGNVTKNCTEVTRDEKSYALKSAYSATLNNRVELPKKYTLGEILSRDNMYIWMYSAKANNQELSVILFDTRSGANYIQKKEKVVLDWTGWKRIKIEKNDWNYPYALSSFNKGDVVAEETDTAYFWISYTFDGKVAKEDTLFYIDSIWFSDNHIDGAEKLVDLSRADASVTKQFKNHGGAYAAYKPTTEKPFADRKYSLRVAPAEENYNGVVTQMYYNASLTDFTYGENKYVNVIMYSEAANNQEACLYINGKDANGSRARGYIKFAANNGSYSPINWTGWKVVSVPITDLKVQDKNISTMVKLESIQLMFPDWNNGVKNVVEGETYTYYNANKDKHYDDIDEVVFDDTLLYIDSVFLSDIDMSQIVLETEPNVTGIAGKAEYKVAFKAPVDYINDTEFYANSIEVKKNDAVVPASEYTVSTEGNKLFVTINETDYSSSYSVTVKGGTFLKYGQIAEDVVATFNTVDEPAIKFAAAADKESMLESVTTAPEKFVTLSARLLFENEEDEAVNASMVLGIYKDNALVGSAKGVNNVIGAGESANISASAFGNFEGCTAKAFVWDMTNAILKPVKEAKTLNK